MLTVRSKFVNIVSSIYCTDQRFQELLNKDFYRCSQSKLIFAPLKQRSSCLNNVVTSCQLSRMMCPKDRLGVLTELTLILMEPFDFAPTFLTVRL